MIKNTKEFTPDWVSSPGDTIKDILEELEWTEAEFSKRTDYSPKHITQLLNGNAPITDDTALRLEKVLGSTFSFWLNREAQYREALARHNELNLIEPLAANWLSCLPLTNLISFGWIKKHSDKAQQAIECLKYFGVASISAWEEKYGNLVAAFRSSPKYEIKKGAVAAWLRRGEILASAIDCSPYNKVEFKNALQNIRPITLIKDPNILLRQLVDLCASAGVAVVIEKAPIGCPACGVARWLSPKKALIMLSLRYKTNDQLWFSFFHEAGHIFLHNKKIPFVDFESGQTEENKILEAEANTFAKKVLIPEKYEHKLNKISANEVQIKNFAEQIGISVGVVIGRLQHDKKVSWNSSLNKLKISYTWEADSSQ